QFARLPHRLGTMFFIIGLSPQVKELRTLTMVCWQCHQPAAHRLTQVRNRVSLFFIPLIPLGAKHRLQCLLCGADQQLTEEQATDIINLPAQTHQRR
ncbi:MAG TPA: hypothetical protein VK054_06845, partial [Beutenbergiaceae bacterium]|nr:hypothetical protein [Beutenbergiaceae bacterium]